MLSTLRFDHAILAVNDLSQAQADFAALGFTVFYGGKHADHKTENCLIVFQDDSYIELIAKVASSEPEAPHVREIFGAGDGWIGYALLSQELMHDASAMRHNGLALIGPSENSRLRPDGKRVAWRAAMFNDGMMPFFIEDLTDRSVRVPDDERRIHANGVTGVARIVIAVEDLEPVIVLYRAILNQTETTSTLQMPAIRAVDFALPGTTLTIASPWGEHTELTAHLARRSPCIYAIHLAGGVSGAFEASRTHSALLHSTG
jgi:hypothetical protein